MNQGPLVMEEIDAGDKLAREFDKLIRVKVAFWLKASDEDQRYLYLASDQINDTNFDVAYGEVLRLAHTLRLDGLDRFRLKVISEKNPLAQAAVAINSRFPGPRPTRLGGMLFGGVVVDDVYIYPSPLPAPAT
jgi:hypothetical protein